jgi:hypothetical protein
LKAGHDGGACGGGAEASTLPGLDALFFGFGMMMLGSSAGCEYLSRDYRVVMFVKLNLI